MKNQVYPFDSIALEIGISASDAERATCRFLKWLRCEIENYTEGNRDFIGEKLHWLISRTSFYHLLGLFDAFSGHYSWEAGSAKEYLLRIAPREEWPSIGEEAAEAQIPDPASVARSMRHISLLADDYDFAISLESCDFDSRLYARLQVEEKSYNDDMEFTMVDHVPLTPADVNALIGQSPHEMLLQIQALSNGRDCITSTRGKYLWTRGVFYPHT